MIDFEGHKSVILRLFWVAFAFQAGLIAVCWQWIKCPCGALVAGSWPVCGAFHIVVRYSPGSLKILVASLWLFHGVCVASLWSTRF